MAIRDPLRSSVPGDPLSESGLAAAETLLGHRVAQPALLREALTHRSAASRRDRLGSNERLEFLGDRVLGLIMAEWLTERFPEEHEGGLGRRLAHLVSQPVLAAIASEVGIAALLSVAPGEARAGVKRQSSVLADAMEAMLGALYVDGGIAKARDFVRRAFAATMAAQAAPPKDAKTALQEWAQARGLGLPSYSVTTREGPAHAPLFVVEVAIGAHVGMGSAGTKRLAEQRAASELLRQFGCEGAG